MTDKQRFNKKQFRQRIEQFKAKFSQFVVEKEFLDPDMDPKSYVTWERLEVWVTAIMMDEAMTLSYLTRVLIVLTGILSVLTALLVFRSL